MFTDDFDRPDENLTASANWTNAGGSDATSLQVVSHQLQQLSSTLAAQCPTQSSADHYSQCLIGVTATTWGMFLAARLTDVSNFWGVYMNNGDGNYALYKRVAGTFTKIGSFAVTPANGDVIYISAVGNAITAKYNTVSQISTSDAFNNTEQRQGFIAFGGGTSVVADNFEADAIGGGGGGTFLPQFANQSGKFIGVGIS